MDNPADVEAVGHGQRDQTAAKEDPGDAVLRGAAHSQSKDQGRKSDVDDRVGQPGDPGEAIDTLRPVYRGKHRRPADEEHRGGDGHRVETGAEA